MFRASCLLLCATPDTTATTHAALTASFSRLPSSLSLLSPPLRWWTIDLRNEVGLLSRIYTGFSLCVSDRFPPVRHSLSLRIFMLVRTRQRTQEQGEDAPETALPLASSPSPLGRGFLGLTLVGFVGFFLLLFVTAIAANPITTVLSDASQGWAIFSWSLQDGATGLRVEPSPGWGVRSDIPHRGYMRCHLFSSSSRPSARGRRCRANTDGL